MATAKDTPARRTPARTPKAPAQARSTIRSPPGAGATSRRRSQAGEVHRTRSPVTRSTGASASLAVRADHAPSPKRLLGVDMVDHKNVYVGKA